MAKDFWEVQVASYRAGWARREAITDPKINKLLEEADELDENPTQVALLQEAANLADSSGDLVAAYHARMELIHAATFAGVPDVALVAYAWCLAKQPENPELFNEYELVWRYKWVLSKLVHYPQISRQKIEETLEDMSTRICRLGGTKRIVHDERWEIFRIMGRTEEAAAEYELWKQTQRDEFSDCHACETNGEVRWLLDVGEIERGLQLAAPILAGQLSCASIPQSTYCLVLLPLLNLGRAEEADQYHRAGYRMLKQVPGDVDEAADHLEYLIQIENKAKAVRLMERFLPLAAVGTDVNHQFWFYRASSRLMQLLRGKQNRRRKLRLPTTLACYHEDDTYRPSELANWFHEQAAELARQFDARNETTRYSDALIET